MIEIYTGLPGSGKSLYTADVALQLFRRNKRWYKKETKLYDKGIFYHHDKEGNPIPPVRRKVHSNIRFAEHIEEEWDDYIAYWEDPEQLVKMKDVDILWDEVSTHMDSTQWANVPLELKRMLQQHRKRGIDIIGNTQEFLQIDISMRRLVSKVFELHKIIGSRDPSPTRPPVKRIWGLVVKRQVDPLTFDDEGERKYIRSGFFLIKKKHVYAFDTRQDIQPGKYPPLKHVERNCIDSNCGHTRIIHS